MTKGVMKSKQLMRYGRCLAIFGIIFGVSHMYKNTDRERSMLLL